MIQSHKKLDFKNIDIYKMSTAIVLGFMGFVGTFYSSRFDFNGFSINFTWSIILPMLVTLAWGRRYGIISITLGLVFLYPFFLGSYNGWASIVPALALYLWIMLHGYGSQRRLREKSIYYNIYFLQFIYILIRLVLYITLFPILVQFNPPFWNPMAYTNVDMEIILLFAIKGIIVESILVALCDALLLLPFIRRIFKLPCSKGAKYNTRIMSAIIAFGLSFTLIVVAVYNFIADRNAPLQWMIQLDEKTRIAFLLATILFSIMGGITVRFVQQMLETQEALKLRETQYKLAIEEIKSLNDELEQRVASRTFELQNAVSELEEFSYTISHDLKSPLRAIDGYSKFIIEDYGSTIHGEAKEMIDHIQGISSDMITLINKLLEYAMTSKANIVRETVASDEIIQSVFKEFEVGNSEKDMMLIFEGRLPEIQVDKILFKQAITNILSNAVKFSKEKEPIEIRVGCYTRENEYIFYLKDNGVGFDMKYSSKLFGIFQRLHRSQDFEGTGIGLATVKKIIQKHGGSVWIEAVLNGGATVYFTIPIEIHAENEG